MKPTFQIVVRVLALLCLVLGAFMFDDWLRFFLANNFSPFAATLMVVDILLTVLIMVGAGGTLCLRQWGRILLLVSVIARAAIDIRWVVTATHITSIGRLDPLACTSGLALWLFWIIAAVILVVSRHAFIKEVAPSQ